MTSLSFSFSFSFGCKESRIRQQTSRESLKFELQVKLKYHLLSEEVTSMKKTVQSVLVDGICQAEVATKWNFFFLKNVSISLLKRIQLTFKKVLARICVPLAQIGKTQWAQVPDIPLMFQSLDSGLAFLCFVLQLKLNTRG